MNTVFLATVIGWYLVIVSLYMLLRREQVAAVMLDVLQQRGLFFVMAIITLIIGLLLVASHNVWVMGWPVIITLFGWLVLVAGVMRLVCSETASQMARSFIDHPVRMQAAGIISLVIGLFLLFRVYYPNIGY